MKNINLEITCKWNRFGYWNSCKGLPNFLNVAALPGSILISAILLTCIMRCLFLSGLLLKTGFTVYN